MYRKYIPSHGPNQTILRHGSTQLLGQDFMTSDSSAF
jgi:hypothetical protein